jgi:hypothetical protein
MIPISISSIMGALFRRKIQYSAFALRTLVAQSSSAIVGIIMALSGFGIWSLEAVPIAYMFTSMPVLLMGIGWQPRLSFSIAAFREIFHFANCTMLGNLLALPLTVPTY